MNEIFDIEAERRMCFARQEASKAWCGEMTEKIYARIGMGKSVHILSDYDAKRQWGASI